MKIVNLAHAAVVIVLVGIVIVRVFVQGLAPLLLESVGNVMIRLRNSGKTILLVEQNLPIALNVAGVTHVLNRGRIVYSSIPQKLRENGEIKTCYLDL